MLDHLHLPMKLPGTWTVEKAMQLVNGGLPRPFETRFAVIAFVFTASGSGLASICLYVDLQLDVGAGSRWNSQFRDIIARHPEVGSVRFRGAVEGGAGRLAGGCVGKEALE